MTIIDKDYLLHRSLDEFKGMDIDESHTLVFQGIEKLSNLQPKIDTGGVEVLQELERVSLDLLVELTKLYTHYSVLHQQGDNPVELITKISQGLPKSRLPEGTWLWKVVYNLLHEHYVLKEKVKVNTEDIPEFIQMAVYTSWDILRVASKRSQETYNTSVYEVKE